MGEYDARRKYMEKTYKNLQVQLKNDEYKLIDEYCKLHDISKSRFIFWACNDFIKRGELPPKSEAAPFDEDANIDE